MTIVTATSETTTPVAATSLTVAVIGAGGKMGMRVSNNLDKSALTVRYAENSPAGVERVRAAGREVVDAATAVDGADVVVLAVPDVVLGKVSEDLVPRMKTGAVLLTLDPAAAYAGLLAERADIAYACAHPCHPSVFLERRTDEEYADTFGGIAAPQEVVAALEVDDESVRALAEQVITTIYAPVIAVHWVSVKQLAVLEPTLVETIACMIGDLLKEALEETVNTVGVPAEAARAMLWGHVGIALTNALRGSNPFSEACHIAMDYGRESIIKEDWKKIFRDDELDTVIARMLKIDAVRR
ncbi:NAD(P)-binding domain-containing protein [Kineococcus sp. T13]|uniref:phosphogluconate dehydrogenase C-terminal domain-containing protein n=1 Tax=Kineococcus vitellinus TaxID=2696565 RepID=UPI001412626D|nr:NAD(P)-binding domain-containing protein [Kineococcus vitellinus]